MISSVKKHKFLLFITIVLLMLSMAPFFSTNAIFKDVKTKAAGIKISTGTLDIQLIDNNHNTVGDQSYYLNLDQVTKSQTIGNLSAKDIGTLSSNLSARVSVKRNSNVIEDIMVYLVDSSGKEILLTGNYKALDKIHNMGMFKVKISYSGLVPYDSRGLEVTVELRATQPNDDFVNAQMFTDTQIIRFVPIQIAFKGSEIPIEETLILNKNEWVYIDLFPRGVDIDTLNVIITDNNYDVAYGPGNKSFSFKLKGNFKNEVITITIKLKNGQIYVIKRNIQSK